jgi:hypothetical protein
MKKLPKNNNIHKKSLNINKLKLLPTFQDKKMASGVNNSI